MRDRPTGQEVSFYAENGFVVLPGILSDTECAAWRETVGDRADRLHARERGAVLHPRVPQGLPALPYRHRPGTRRPVLQVGDPLDDEAQNPLVFTSARSQTAGIGRSDPALYITKMGH